MLNRRFTWQGRNTGLWKSCWRFNAQKLLLTVPNLALYALMIELGSGWLIANLGTTVVFTAVNYATGDLWSFARRGSRRLQMTPGSSPESTTSYYYEPNGARYADPRAIHEGLQPPGTLSMRSAPPMRQRHPFVSVVIPCKGNESTIRATVAALLAQDYPALIEVILVGDVGDSTWSVLADIRDPRLILLEQEKTPGKCDPNVKRDKGLRKASGDILALADSDIVMDQDWLSRGVALLRSQGGGLVAGGMRSIHDTYWGRFVDGNVLAAKTPRVSRPYQVTAENFGHRGSKPPITANAVFTRELYENCPLDVAWAYGYEDYEWYWRVVKAGHKILFSGGLTGAHHHRRSFRRLVTEYRQSSFGCAHFIRRHPDSPLARKRRYQAFGLPIAALVGGIGFASAAGAGYAAAASAIVVAALAGLAGREMVRSRSLEAVTYLPATLILGWLYTINLAVGLLRSAPRTDEAPLWDTAPPRSTRRRSAASPPSSRRRARRISWPLAVILAVQAGFSLSLVWSNTAFGDEADYLWQGHLEWANWLHGYPIPAFHDSGAPQIYPALGALADSVGGLAGARILSLFFMLVATVLLYLTTSRLFGTIAAVTSSALWAVSEPVLRLAFATYDPMACLLVALSMWLAVQAGCGGGTVNSSPRQQWRSRWPAL